MVWAKDVEEITDYTFLQTPERTRTIISIITVTIPSKYCHSDYWTPSIEKRFQCPPCGRG
jgi:hypothetical protein